MSFLRSLHRRGIGVARARSGRAASWAMLGQVSAIVASTANFLLLARILGPAEYGLVAGTWALVLAVGPIAALGADRLAVRDISGAHVKPNEALTAGMLTAAAGWLLVIGALVALHPLVLPQTSLALLLLLAVADIVAMGTVSIISGVSFATGDAKAGGIAAVTVNLTKLLAVVAFAVTGGGTDAVRWATFYAAFAVVSAGGQLVYAIRRYGRPSVHGFHLGVRIRDGLPYSGNVVASVVQNDADKTLLVRAGLQEAAGHYSVAYRLASIAYLPVLAVLQAMFPRFFAVGREGGLPATAAFGRKLAKPLLAYALVASFGLMLCAPLVPLVVGEEYRSSVPLLMLLAPLVVVKVVQSLAGDVLTGADRQHTRTRCVAVAAATNVAINLVLIPILGITGALIATAVAEVLQATLLLGAIRHGLRHPSVEERGDSVGAALPSEGVESK